MENPLKQAADLFKKGERSQAVEILKEVIRSDPNNLNAWYGLALCLDDVEKKIFCLQRVLRLNPNHQKAKELLARLKDEQIGLANLTGPTTAAVAPKNAKLNPITSLKVLVALTALIFVAVAVLFGADQVSQSTASATATASYSVCRQQFSEEFTELLSRFFRQEAIAGSTARINLPEQIARLEDIRTQAWEIEEKSCAEKTHALMIDYMDKSIMSYILFSRDDYTWILQQEESLKSLLQLDEDIEQNWHNGGLVGLFREKGYYYWEGLDDPDWRDGLET